MAAPVMQIASIGTQITEAFAGLDRIRELMQTRTEDATTPAAAARRARGRGRVRQRQLRIQARCAGAEDTSASVRLRGRPPRSSVQRIGQEHTDRTRDGVLPADRAGACWSTDGISMTLRLRDYRAAARRRAAGQLPVRRHHRRQHALRSPEATAEQIRAVSRIAHATSSSRGSRSSTTRSSANAA